MEAVRVIFGQIQGDHINFTMVAVAAMLIFSAGSKKKKIDFYMSQRICLPNLVLIDATLCQILLKQKCDGRTEARKDGRKHGRTDGGYSYGPPFCSVAAMLNFSAGSKKIN